MVSALACIICVTAHCVVAQVSRQIISAPSRNPCDSGFVLDSAGKCRRVFSSGTTTNQTTSGSQVVVTVSNSTHTSNSSHDVTSGPNSTTTSTSYYSSNTISNSTGVNSNKQGTSSTSRPSKNPSLSFIHIK